MSSSRAIPEFPAPRPSDSSGSPASPQRGRRAPGAFSETERRTIAQKARTLDERIHGLDAGVVCSPDTLSAATKKKATKRIQRWVKRATNGDGKRFERRLQWDGWTPSTIQQVAAGEPGLTDDNRASTAWVDLLDQSLTHVEHRAPGTDAPDASINHPACRDDAPLAFEHLLIGFVEVARQHLEQTCSVLSASVDSATDELTPRGCPEMTITEGALNDAERNLLRRLSQQCATTLFSEFSIHRSVESSLQITRDAAAPPPRDDAAYRSFVDHMQNGGLRTFFLEYAVLGRIVATILRQWIENVSDLLERAVADREDIARLIGTMPERLTSIGRDRSDPHGGGATVHVLTFNGDAAVVYKPKPVDLCAAFQDVLAWCNDRGSASVPALRTMGVAAKPGYGWVEYVNHVPCTSSDDVRTFFERAGALLALAYACNGEDLHHGNIIASGADPVLIDTEVLLCPAITADLSPSSDLNACSTRTVMHTGMLPSLTPQQSGAEPAEGNISGFFGFDRRTVTRKGWQQVNGDKMTWAETPRSRSASVNLPVWNGKRADARDFLDTIVEGFASMHAFLEEERDAVLAPGGPLERLVDQPSRFVFRLTSVYGKTLRRLRHPRFLRSGLDRDIETEFLVRGFIKKTRRPPYWSVVRAERDQLNQCDIPLFRANTASRHLFTQQGEDLGPCFQTSGADVARAKLRSLDAQDRKLQCSLIRAAFYSSTVTGSHDAVPDSSQPDSQLSPRSDRGEERSPLTSNEAVEEARRIADRMIDARTAGRAGHPTWIALVRHGQSGRLRVSEVSPSLHDGRCGIALFLASLAAVLERDRSGAGQTYAACAWETIAPLVEALNTSPDAVADRLYGKVGGTAGLGGIVYGLAQVGAIMQRQDVLDAAERASRLITVERLAADDEYDLISGSAGAVLGLLTLYRATESVDPLNRAIEAGQHLLANRSTHPGAEGRAWYTTGQRMRTGLSHGASGIAHALLDLGEQTGEAAFREAAAEAIAFEDDQFAAEAGNWLPYADEPDAASSVSPRFRATWCHGAPGILLMRSAHATPRAGLRPLLLDAAIETTEHAIDGQIDHVCCGGAGRLLALHEAARAFDHSPLMNRVRRKARALVQRAHRRGHYRLTTDPHPLPRPGFLQGLAGIGHTLLYLTHPDIVPAVHLLR